MITYTKNDVAKMFEISRTTLYRHMEKNNIDKNSKLTDKEISILKQSIRPTLTLEDNNTIKTEEHQQIIEELQNNHLNDLKAKDEQINKLEAIVESLTKQNEIKIIEQFTEKLNHFESLLVKMESSSADLIEESLFNEDDTISETEVNEELNEMIKQIQNPVTSEIAVEQIVDEIEVINEPQDDLLDAELNEELEVSESENNAATIEESTTKMAEEALNEEVINANEELEVDEIENNEAAIAESTTEMAEEALNEEVLNANEELEVGEIENNAEAIEESTTEMAEEALNEEVMTFEEEVDMRAETENVSEPVKKKKRWWKR